MAGRSAPLQKIVDHWDTRFGFFWYNDREIFQAGQEELDCQAGELAEAGINHVITFSCSHFRWSFRRGWERLTQALYAVGIDGIMTDDVQRLGRGTPVPARTAGERPGSSARVRGWG